MTGDDQIEQFGKEMLGELDNDDRIVSFEEMLALVDEENETAAFKSSIPSLDDALKGFEPGELVVISGITGEGKSTLSRTLTVNFSKQNIKALWFTYEEPPRYFLKKFPELPVAYMPARLSDKSTDWIQGRIRVAVASKGINVVFVDHLHYLIDLMRTQNSSFEIGSIVRNLKKIALLYGIVIFLIAHTTKIKFDEEPGIGSVRDSSFIEQEADTVLYIWRKADEENVSTLKIAKNRKTGVVNKKIKLVLVNNIFQELEEEFDFEEDETA